MATLIVRVDEAMETALRALAEGKRSRSDAVRYAVLLWTITVINAWNRLGAVVRAWPLT